MSDEPGTIRHIHKRIDAIHEEFQRRKREGLPPPAWDENFDHLVAPPSAPVVAPQ